MQIALNTTVCKCSGVVSLRDVPEADCLAKVDALRTYLQNLPDIKDYAIILHNRDINELGEPKTPHIHFVYLNGKTKKKSTWINAISNALGVSTLAVSLESYSSFEAVFQYLIHKNNPEKAQYSPDEIVTSIGQDEIEQYLSSTSVVANLDYFVGVVAKSDTLLDVMREIGIGLYQHYRKAIVDIWMLVKGNTNYVGS